MSRVEFTVSREFDIEVRVVCDKCGCDLDANERIWQNRQYGKPVICNMATR